MTEGAKSSHSLSRAELRELIYKGSETGFIGFFRELSLYPTWLLLKTPISANGVTALSALCALAGAACYATALPDLLGALLFLLAQIFDYVDGGMARVRGSAGWKGQVLDSVVGELGMGCLLIGLSINTYNSTASAWALILGLLAVMLNSLSYPYSRYLFAYVKGNQALPEMVNVYEWKTTQSKKGLLFRLVRLFRLYDFLFLFLLPLVTLFNLEPFLLAFFALYAVLNIFIHYFYKLPRM